MLGRPSRLGNSETHYYVTKEGWKFLPHHRLDGVRCPVGKTRPVGKTPVSCRPASASSECHSAFGLVPTAPLSGRRPCSHIAQSEPRPEREVPGPGPSVTSGAGQEAGVSPGLLDAARTCPACGLHTCTLGEAGGTHRAFSCCPGASLPLPPPPCPLSHPPSLAASVPPITAPTSMFQVQLMLGG